jgi:glycosyltransferase involved in cell wall biosynthesis
VPADVPDSRSVGARPYEGAPQLRFSFIIPAHNEEKYIGSTLACIAALSYPADLYEVIVVENGSSDGTLDVASEFAVSNIRVLSKADPGVSAAKNAGIDALSQKSDWVIFLDADTILGADFLGDLNRMLRTSRKSLAVGTTKVLPLGGNRRARAWFAFFDLTHWFGGSLAIQIARRSLFPGLRFDENLAMGEDLLFIKQARRSGSFFFLPTRTVFTSTRRFDAIGYWKLFLHWSIVAMLPKSKQNEITYRTVR